MTAARDVRMGFAVSRAERREIKRAARAAKLPVSEYVRVTLANAYMPEAERANFSDDPRDHQDDQS